MKYVPTAWLAVFLLVVSCIPSVFGQGAAANTYVVAHRGMQDGLPQSSVNDLLHTDDGFLWLATFGGLVRYDGATFTTFDRSNTPCMRSDRVLLLYGAQNGTLWASTEDGFLEFAPDGTCTLHKLEVDGQVYAPMRMMEDGHGRLWISLDGKPFMHTGDRFARMEISTDAADIRAALDREIVIPVHLHATVNGTFELSWDASGIPAGWTYTLEDPATGTRTDLDKATSFRFEVDAARKVAATSNGVFTLQAGEAPVLLIHARGPAVTGIEDLASLPRTVELDQNYPNPFNPSTTIRFGLPEQAEVKLEVYDLLGRRVAVLDQGLKTAGYHQVAFDAGRLASGVYLYRLTVGGRVLTNRMLLIK